MVLKQRSSGMKLHEIMLSEPFAKAKKDGIKPFEIRKNDRD